MNVEHLEDEFERVAEYAFNGARSGVWDGLKEWNLLKDTFGSMAVEFELKWSDTILGTECSTFRESLITELEEIKSDGSFNEANHSIIECACIPLLNDFSIQCLMQVAFHIGQIHAMLHQFSTDHKQWFNDLRMGNFNTYVKF